MYKRTYKYVYSLHINPLIYTLLFIILSITLVYSDDSIQSSPYWNCNQCPDTSIQKVVQRKNYRGNKYIEVYYRIQNFRKPSTYWVKVYK